MTGLGLIEAKNLVDAAPKAIKEKVKEDEAKEIARNSPTPEPLSKSSKIPFEP
jgi:hypothetical protein